jgi:alpha-amylase
MEKRRALRHGNGRIRRFFQTHWLSKTPRYYIIKWLTDYIADYGIDGYRADTVKHTEASVWADFKAQSEYAFATGRKQSNKVLDNNPFTPLPKYTTITLVPVKVLILDKKVNYFENGFNSMINFEFKYDAQKTMNLYSQSTPLF